jgi:hypothetical protein
MRWYEKSAYLSVSGQCLLWLVLLQCLLWLVLLQCLLWLGASGLYREGEVKEKYGDRVNVSLAEVIFRTFPLHISYLPVRK